MALWGTVLRNMRAHRGRKQCARPLYGGERGRSRHCGNQLCQVVAGDPVVAKLSGRTGPMVLFVVVGYSGSLGLQSVEQVPPLRTDPCCPLDGYSGSLGPPGAGRGQLVRNQTVLRNCAGRDGLRLVLGMVRVERSPTVVEVGHGGGRILEPEPGVEPRSPVNRAHMIDNIRLPLKHSYHIWSNILQRVELHHAVWP